MTSAHAPFTPCDLCREGSQQPGSPSKSHLARDQDELGSDNGSTRYTYYRCSDCGAQWEQTYDYEDHGRYWHMLGR